jgi:hypothetical protein
MSYLIALCFEQEAVSRIKKRTSKSMRLRNHSHSSQLYFELLDNKRGVRRITK